MKKSTWRRQHQWLGIILAPFVILFCLSGIVLNHAKLFQGIDISRTLLPSEYRYSQWNQGLLRGTQKWRNKVLIYGNAGIWAKEKDTDTITDFNRGLPKCADLRNIRGMAVMPNGSLYAMSQRHLYRLNPHGVWEQVDILQGKHEKLSDITQKGDSLIITGRSYVCLLYTSDAADE